jgi:hypothetical protein
MEKKPFRTWRKGRLQKMKEQKEAKKKEADTATFLCAPVQFTYEDVAVQTKEKQRTVSVEEGEEGEADTVTHWITVLLTKEKPRTVLVEEGEDDTVTHWITVLLMTVFSSLTLFQIIHQENRITICTVWMLMRTGYQNMKIWMT